MIWRYRNGLEGVQESEARLMVEAEIEAIQREHVNMELDLDS